MLQLSLLNHMPSLFFLFSDLPFLITYMDRTSLYCSSEHLILFEMGEAQLVGPTAFCTLTGLWLLDGSAKKSQGTRYKQRLSTLPTSISNGLTVYQPVTASDYYVMIAIMQWDKNACKIIVLKLTFKLVAVIQVLLLCCHPPLLDYWRLIEEAEFFNATL